MTELQQGGNAAISGPKATVSFSWTLSSGASVEADVSAYLLTAAGKVRDDNDMIFYNNASGAGGAVRFDAGTGRGSFEIDLASVPPAIERIVFCATLNEAQARKQTLAMIADAQITAADGATTLSFRPSLGQATEAAMTFGELYRRAGSWKFRAVGQGFNGGLAPLARSFGIDVAEEATAPTPPPAPQPAPPPPPVPTPAAPPSPFGSPPSSPPYGSPPPATPYGAPPPATPYSAPPPPSPYGAAPPPSSSPTPAPSQPVRLGKISLEKPGQKVSLEKKGSSFGEIVVNLNWSRGKRGFFGGGTAIDLDLGCLFELSDGRKGVVQALGNVFGSFNDLPYIQLSGDDRTGDVSQGETLRINGAFWSTIRRVALFANIYDGVPNWQQTDGVVTVKMPQQDEIEVRMTEGRNDKRLCGIVLIENNGGRFDVTRINEYFRDQEQLDHRFGWGLRWRAGSKD